jgi:hypothetical protein
MSWQSFEYLKQYTITTGDGKTYTAKYLKPNASVSYNVAEYEYVDISGTDVQRRLPKGRRFNIEIVFDGEGYLEKTGAFRISANNTKNWVISHPVYGLLYVQPLGLTFDNQVWNLTKITGTVVETPKDFNVNTRDVGYVLNQESIPPLTQVTIETFVADAPDVEGDVSAIAMLTAQVNGAFDSIKDLIEDAVDYNSFLNAYTSIISLINTSVFNSIDLLFQVQQLALFPINFVGSEVYRMRLLGAMLGYQYGLLASTSTKSVKALYAMFASSTIASMCTASVTNVNYITRSEVQASIDLITDSYNDYLTNLDAISGINGSVEGGYIADANGLNELTITVRNTIAVLSVLADKSKREITVYLEEDMPIVLATYKYYGLNLQDTTIDEFIAVNNIGLNELFMLRKGRAITYYA